MAIAYLALGSNLGDRRANLRAALGALPPNFVIQRVSSCYETEPAYVLDQPRFYNLVCCTDTKLAPLVALRELKRLESSLGRLPGPRYGPRPIDIDLLFYEDLVLNSPGLSLPHPALAERAFVLVPLAEIAPELVHPALGLTVAELRDRLSQSARREVWRVGDVASPEGRSPGDSQ